MNVIATFPSSHAALAAEQGLAGQGLAVELIPVPRQIRSDCGFCLLTDAGAADSGEAARRLGLVRAWGALELWRIDESAIPPLTRKVKTYERIP